MGNAAGLVWSVGQGMGEGWSDFYALSLLNNTNADDPNAQYASGAYATYKLGGGQDNYVYGIRRFPYSTDNSGEPAHVGGRGRRDRELHGRPSDQPARVRNQRRVRSAQHRRSLGADAVGDPQPRDRRSGRRQRRRADRQPDDAAARDGRVEDDAVQSQLHRRARRCSMRTARPTPAPTSRWIWEGFADRGLGYDAEAPLGQAGFINIGHMGLKPPLAKPLCWSNTSAS